MHAIWSVYTYIEAICVLNLLRCGETLISGTSVSDVHRTSHGVGELEEMDENTSTREARDVTPRAVGFHHECSSLRRWCFHCKDQ